MFPRNPYKVPEGTSTEEAFNEWLGIELDRLDEEIPIHVEVQLLGVIYRFCNDPKNCFFKKKQLKIIKSNT